MNKGEISVNRDRIWLHEYLRIRLLRLLIRLSSVLFASVWPLFALDETRISDSRTMLDLSGFVENDETRRKFSQAIFTQSPALVETDFEIYQQIADGRFVHFEVRKAIKDWYVIFRNQQGLSPNETYPLWGRGNWIIKKNLMTGSIIQAKVFLQNNERSFVRIRPAKDGRTRISLYFYGTKIGHEITLAAGLKEIITGPFAQIAELTERAIDWNLIFPNASLPEYRQVQLFGQSIKRYSEQIFELDDAAGDDSGRNVFIETGESLFTSDGIRQKAYSSESLPEISRKYKTGFNCSGYLKWIADSLNFSWSEGRRRYLPLEPLRAPTSRHVGNPWSDSRSAASNEARQKLDVLLRDPYFGLDWTRNLARRVEESRVGRYLSNEEVLSLNGPELPGLERIPDLGYRLQDMESVLYYLAVLYPGEIFFAAINSNFVRTEEDPDPIVLHQYWHVTALAPWFDNSSDNRGGFHVTVLDTGDVAENFLRRSDSDTIPGYIRFITRKANENAGRRNESQIMVHLVRVRLPWDFRILPLPS